MNVGIDFGTTNSSVAWFNPNTRSVESILFANQNAHVPSVVYWDNDAAKRRFGHDAVAASEDAEKDNDVRRRVAFRSRLATSFKTDFARNSPGVATLNMGEPISPDDVVRAYLGWLIKEIREKTGTPEQESISATLTYPATSEWSTAVDAVSRLKTIAEQVGFSNVRMVPEPEAAFREAERHDDLGNGVLVFDLGGGTLDMVYYKRNANGEWGRAFISADGISGSAGDAFDDAVVELLDGQVRRASNNVMSAINVVAGRRRARTAKEMLSVRDKVMVPWIAKSNDDIRNGRAEFTRDAFERHSNQVFANIQKALESYVESIKASQASIDTVLLVGGSTNIPKVRKIVEESTGARCIRPVNADFYVALGAVDKDGERNEEPGVRPIMCGVVEYCDVEKYLDKLCEHVSRTFTKLASYSRWRGRLYAIGVPCDPRAELLTLPGVPLWKLHASSSFDTKKLFNAKMSMDVLSKEKETSIVEVCLVQGDSTFLGGGREGFLCTARGIFMKLDDDYVAKFVEWGKDLTFHVRDNGFYVKKSECILGSADMFWPPFQLHELVTGLTDLCAWINENRPTQ